MAHLVVAGQRRLVDLPNCALDGAGHAGDLVHPLAERPAVERCTDDLGGVPDAFIELAGAGLATQVQVVVADVLEKRRAVGFRGEGLGNSESRGDERKGGKGDEALESVHGYLRVDARGEFAVARISTSVSSKP